MSATATASSIESKTEATHPVFCQMGRAEAKAKLITSLKMERLHGACFDTLADRFADKRMTVSQAIDAYGHGVEAYETELIHDPTQKRNGELLHNPAHATRILSALLQPHVVRMIVSGLKAPPRYKFGDQADVAAALRSQTTDVDVGEMLCGFLAKGLENRSVSLAQLAALARLGIRSFVRDTPHLTVQTSQEQRITALNAIVCGMFRQNVKDLAERENLRKRLAA